MAENTQDNKMKNPKEIVSVVRTKTLTIDNALSVVECEGRNSPLKFYSKFSRFPITIINEEKKVTTGNINVDDISDIAERTRFIYGKDMEASFCPMPQPTDEPDSPAYTVIMSSGNGLKGKSPAQLLLEDPEGNKEKLKNQYTWLKNNLDKNPKFKESNKKQMDAIMDASKLLKEGKLKPVSSNRNQGKFVIYEPGMRPLTRRKDPQGNTFVYEIGVYWYIGNQYPVEVVVTNYYAPVTQNEKGLLNVHASKKVNVTQNSMRLFAKEWLNIIHMIETNKRTFENAYGSRLYKRAIDADNENRRNAGINTR